MTGLEVVVRPVVFPNIRPAPARALAPEDNPDQGIAVLSGSGGALIDLPHTWSASVSQSSSQQESVRVLDKERVYQVDDQGNINRNNFIDVERLKKVRLDAPEGPSKYVYADPPAADNVETREANVVRSST